MAAMPVRESVAETKLDTPGLWPFGPVIELVGDLQNAHIVREAIGKVYGRAAQGDVGDERCAFEGFENVSVIHSPAGENETGAHKHILRDEDEPVVGILQPRVVLLGEEIAVGE